MWPFSKLFCHEECRYAVLTKIPEHQVCYFNELAFGIILKLSGYKLGLSRQENSTVFSGCVPLGESLSLSDPRFPHIRWK